VVKQPDIPAGPAAEDEPARPATDPLAANGLAWQAGDSPAPSAWPAPQPPAANSSARSVTDPLAGDPFGGPPTDPIPRIPPGTPAAPPAEAGPLPAEAAPLPAEAGLLPAEAGQPPGPHQTALSARLWLTVAAAVLGITGLAISLVGVAGQVLPRRFTQAQQQQIMSWQVASRWRTGPAGKIFPASVSYLLPSSLLGAGSGLTLAARRVGIAPQSDCPAAVDPALARLLGKRGCDAVLRATYTDSTGSFVITVGVAIMHGSAPAARSLPAGNGLRPVPFPGTLAAQFGGRQRQMSGAAAHGPYLVLYTAGYTDGRRRERVAANPYASSEMKDVAAGLADGIGAVLGTPPPAPRCPGAPGC
jgi:hypothetical protein